jgi:hypothetical protein
MQKIVQYPFKPNERQHTVEVPEGAEALHIDVDADTNRPTLWMLINTAEPHTQRRKFYIFEPGEALPNFQFQHLNTFQSRGEMFHAFEQF